MSQLVRPSSLLRSICALLFLVAAPAAHAAIVDDFGDGNDTTPAWSHLDPTAGATFAASSLSYLISVSATGNASNPARAFSLRQDASFADVVVAADLVGFDAVTGHRYGIAARSTSTLAPTHDGYALVLTAPGTLSLLQLDNQVATTLASVPVTVSSSADYRLVLSATGSSPVQLVGKIFAASDLAQPIATVRYTDSLAPIYLSGFTGFLVADGGALQNQALSASFDDFFASSFNADADADGLSDGAELSIGTDPSDPDTDGDGLLDGAEVGTGVFGPQISISTQADGARMVMTADMDGDGDIDVLSASFDDTTIAWHENDGTPLDGPWAEHLITTIGDRPTTLFPADVDGDGDTDVVAASSPNFGVSWYENDGTPAVGAWTERPITADDGGEFSNVQKVSAADMDNDGDIDLLAMSGPDALVWYENDGTPAVGVWTPHPISIAASSFIATDIDSDGDTDGLTISQFDFIAWYENDGTPAVGALPEHQLAVNVGLPIRWVHAADFDGDGDTDVLSRSVADYIVWYENDGTPAIGDWIPHPVSSGAGSSISSYPSDVDGDGDMDVLAAENQAFEVTWYENDGTPAVGAWTRHVISIAQYPEWVVTADIDGDGDADAVSASFFDDKIAWYEQQNVADPLDSDSDNDGLFDGFEVAYGFNPLVAGEQGQDADADGLSNVAEQTAGTNPNLSDTDGDGLLDGFEVTYGFNPLLAGEQGQDPDGDALANFYEQAAGTNPHVADTDGDGLLDGPEVANGLDPLDSDTDDDGLSDSAELNIHGTNPILADTDGDGLGDGAEVNTYGTNPLTPDTDGDGLLDGFETAYGFNPLVGGQQNQDPDGDGLTNLQEQNAGTNPNLADSDGDGLSDSAELNTYGTNPVLADTDADGINDGSELSIGTDPLDADSDNDGLLDGVEIGIGTNPLDPDMDDDGLSDGAEVNTHGTNPLVADTDGDGLSDSAEVSAQTNPLLRDTDGDKMRDGFEVANGFDPLDPDQNDNSRYDGQDDQDADGLSNGSEDATGTSPIDSDTDNDGLLDGAEIGTGVFGPQISISTQADGARMVMTADMDGDGDIDVLSASFDDTTIAWHENDGTPLDGPWAEHLITTIGDRPTTLFPADVDGDGDTDVVAASSPNFGVSWYENDGTPAVGAWTERPITANDGGEFSNVQKVSAADMDNDGDIDLLAVSGPNGALVWYENDGTPAVGVWTPHPISIAASSFIATDIDSDGNTDGLTISAFDFIAWYENDGTPAVGALPEHQLAVNVGQPIRWVHAADFDGDGDTDVLSRSVADYIVWYENDGTPAVGAWPGHPVSSGAGSSISSYPSDVDGDGDMDVLAAENEANQVTWYENDGTPAVGAWTRHVISIAQYPEWVVTADIDGDGDADAVSASFFDDKIAWYEQRNVADPLDPDTDDDGLLDGFEVANGIDPLDSDSDNDGLGDGTEVNTYGSNPLLADTDGDAAIDGSDNCPVTANPTQSDVGGVGSGLPDGVGDACQCGDVDDSGVVDSADVVAYRDSLANPAGQPLTPAGVAKCSVIGVAAPCEVLDVSVIRRALQAPPLLPGIAQVCSAARGP